MKRLRLSFTSFESPELFCSEFDSGSSGQTFRSVRGKTNGAYNVCGSFQWSAAVKALCFLAIRAKLFGIDNAKISGEHGSVCAALDYALSKPPLWLIEMFGSEPSGRAYAQKIFRRTNAERKRPGPVVISFRGERVSQIEVTVRGNAVTDQNDLSLLLRRLVKDLEPKKQNGLPSLLSAGDLLSEDRYNRNGKFNLERYAAVFEREVFQMLSCINVFEPKALTRQARALFNNPSFKRIVPHKLSGVERLTQSLPGSIRLGIGSQQFLRRELCKDEPLLVCTTLVQPSVISLFTFLKEVRGYNIELDYCYPYGIDLVQAISEGRFHEPPALCFAGAGPISLLLQRDSEYSPFMLSPSISHRIVYHGQELSRGSYCLVNDHPNTATFCFDDLVRQGVLDRNRIKLEHCEPDEAFGNSTACDPEFRSLQWFPHYIFHRDLLGANLHGSSDNLTFSQVNLGVVHQSAALKPSTVLALRMAVHDAWLSLKADGKVRQEIVGALLRDNTYATFLPRAVGLHNLRSTSVKGEPSPLTD